jgi:hypothetical protein
LGFSNKFNGFATTVILSQAVFLIGGPVAELNAAMLA